jgi:hypothetical protein
VATPGITVEERAIRAWQIRYDARIRAREMSPDGPSFEWLVRQAVARGLQGEEIYQSIINSSSLTDEEVNKKL